MKSSILDLNHPHLNVRVSIQRLLIHWLNVFVSLDSASELQYRKTPIYEITV